jgi:hypothetical protein
MRASVLTAVSMLDNVTNGPSAQFQTIFAEFRP